MEQSINVQKQWILVDHAFVDAYSCFEKAMIKTLKTHNFFI
jgi:hypothetical protein